MGNRPTNKAAKGHYYRTRLLELGSYEAVAKAEGVSHMTVRRYAGAGLTNIVRGRKEGNGTTKWML